LLNEIFIIPKNFTTTPAQFQPSPPSQETPQTHHLSFSFPYEVHIDCLAGERPAKAPNSWVLSDKSGAQHLLSPVPVNTLGVRHSRRKERKHPRASKKKETNKERQPGCQ